MDAKQAKATINNELGILHQLGKWKYGVLALALIGALVVLIAVWPQ